MGDYDFTDSDTLSDISTKLENAKTALATVLAEVAQVDSEKVVQTANLRDLFGRKIAALEERKRKLENGA